jgi:hypothetical protein
MEVVMQRPSNLLCFVLLFFLFSLSGNVQGGGRGTQPPIVGERMEIGKIGNLCAKGQLPQKISRIQLAGGRFDPLFESEPFPVPQSMKVQAYPPGEAGYYILQFKGPVKQDWKDAVMEAGATILDYVPDFAFIVKMGQETKLRVERMDSVRWVGVYQPAYRIEPQLMRTYVLGEQAEAVTLIVVTFREENVNLIAEVLKTMGGIALEVSETEWKGKIRVQIDSGKIAEISKIQGVKWIEKAPVWKLFNDVGRGIMNVGPVWSPNNLFGVGQVVAVADTGLDQGFATPANLHDDFEDGEVTPNSRVIQIFDRVGDGADDVNSGHGTHVAGSVLGNGKQSGSDPPGHSYVGSYAGVAPEARLIFQAIEDNVTEDLTGIPGDLNVLFNQARTVGAHIHTNSWGASTAGAYTSFSEDVDQNAWSNKSFTILFSAGNEGVDSNGDGIIDLYSLGSPATAKNCITVGATENNRPTGSSPAPGYDFPWATGSWAVKYPANPIASDHVSNNSEGMAAFSSRGPCLDGRFKPDIVAPGTNIISTKSSLTAATKLWSTGGLSGGLEDSYVFSGGTSMSTPLVAGAAALVREFYMDQAITPSSALIKATLINGAVDIPGQYAGPEVVDGARPNQAEGWGRVNVGNSLYPTAPRTLRYMDVTSSISTYQNDGYSFTLNDGSVPLRVTLVWTDYPGSTVAGGGLVNDLDLNVTDPNGVVHFPDNASQLGPIEHKCYHDNPAWAYGTSANRGAAVRFTPSFYPATIDRALFYVYSLSYPATFTVNVWDDDGAGGNPGTLLHSASTTGRKQGWYTVDIPDVAVDSGDFYVEMRIQTANKPYFVSDQLNSAEISRSLFFDGSTWTSWTSAGGTGDLTIQAIISSPDHHTSADRVNNVVGIDVATSATGNYVITIGGHNVPMGPQPYALVVSGGALTALTQIPGLPDTPGDLSGKKISDSQIDLSWTDNSANEDGFSIERRTSVGSFAEIDTTLTDIATYSDTSVSAGNTYHYRVRSFNAQGQSSYSDEAVVTIENPPSPSPPPIWGGGGGGGGGCFIATAAYGSRMAKDVEVLEKMRDEYLLSNELGRAFVSLYYRYSPSAARLIAQSPMMRKIARIGLYPVVGLSKWFVEMK